MNLKVSNTNAPVWRDITVYAELPAKLKCLDELAHNVWWSWNSDAKKLFHDIDPDTWRDTGENPVLLLQKLSFEKYQSLAKDELFLARLNEVYKEFKNYMKKPLRKDVPSISYFSMEYGLCSALKIYSGGLGVLAGDYIKEASDSCINMTAVGFLYRYGYFNQTLSMDGQQIAEYVAQNFNQIPVEPVLNSDGTPMVLAVPYRETPVIVDLAMSMFSYGKLERYALEGRECPVDGGFDSSGNLTRDPVAISESRQVLPMGYWKGSSLAIALDLIVSLISGGRTTKDIGELPCETEVSQIFMAISLDAFPDHEDMEKRIGETLSYIDSSIPREENGSIHYPGEGMKRTRCESMRLGVFAEDSVWEKVKAL